MRRACVIAIVISLGLVALGRVGYSASQPGGEPIKSFEASGRIVAFDPQQKLVTFEPVSKGEASQRIMFSVDEQSAVSRGGVALKTDDLQPSEEDVRIEYIMKDGSPVARSIQYEKPSGLRRIDGVVDEIDLLKGQVAITPSGLLAGDTQRQFIIVNEYTVVSRDGQKAYLTDLMVGNRATIEYTKSGDTFVAYSLTMHPATPRETTQ